MYSIVVYSGLPLIRPPLGPVRVSWLEGWPHLQRWICTIQWTPSNPATLGTRQSVLIRGVASFQGWICTRKHNFVTFWSGLNTGVASFQGSRLEGVHYNAGNHVMHSLLWDNASQRKINFITSAWDNASMGHNLTLHCLFNRKYHSNHRVCPGCAESPWTQALEDNRIHRVSHLVMRVVWGNCSGFLILSRSHSAQDESPSMAAVSLR